MINRIHKCITIRDIWTLFEIEEEEEEKKKNSK